MPPHVIHTKALPHPPFIGKIERCPVCEFLQDMHKRGLENGDERSIKMLLSFGSEPLDPTFYLGGKINV